MSASKQKGTAAETAVARWLQTHGFLYAERRTMTGNRDRGDISGIPGVVIEVKNCRRDGLPAWVDEANLEAAHVDADQSRRGGIPDFGEPSPAGRSKTTGVVVHKRVGTTNPGEWFVTMTLDTFAELIR